MSTPEHEHFTNLTVRRPEDVRTRAGGPVPLGWQAEKRTAHHDRIVNNTLPADFPHPVQRGDAGDALAVLALDTAIRRDLANGRGTRILEAVELGATWHQVADALDLTPEQARMLLRQWADSQHHDVYLFDVKEGRDRPFGLDEQAYSAVLALIERGDDETAAAVTR